MAQIIRNEGAFEVAVGGETQVLVVLCGQLIRENGWVSRRSIGN
jgi:hypothetical protein